MHVPIAKRALHPGSHRASFFTAFSRKTTWKVIGPPDALWLRMNTSLHRVRALSLHAFALATLVFASATGCASSENDEDESAPEGVDTDAELDEDSAALEAYAENSKPSP